MERNNDDLIDKFINSTYVVSVEINNQYKHPSKEVMKKISVEKLFVITEYMYPLTFIYIKK